MSFIYAQVAPYPVSHYIKQDIVRQAMANVDQNSGHPSAVKNAFMVPTDSLTVHAQVPGDPRPDDWVHFNADGQLIIGQRFAQVYLTSIGVAVGIFNKNTKPADFELHQNYPNPFNPTTNIRYSISHAGHVELTIVNINGSKVATLISKYQTAGIHQITWDGSEYASGIYFYRLKANGREQMRKMILIK